jgi:serine/threonine protein kinase
VGSALSSTGDLEKSELLLKQAIENTENNSVKALAHFNLFQVYLRRESYESALTELQTAIELDSEQYALHDINKGYYPIERLLGAGGMGCVLLCKNKNRLIKQERVVVKCFWETLKGDITEVFKEPFHMSDIAGDFVPKPLDYGYANNVSKERAYFVTEYIEDAIDGEAWLEKNGPMDLETTLEAGLQIAKGLQLAHDNGIYHLDLKPANLLLKQTESGIEVKIIDFGLSQVATSLSELGKQKSKAGLSVFGQAVLGGTLDYAPPEQQSFARHCEPDAKNDVFAFGATMYRLCTQKIPRLFRERNLPNIQSLRDLLCDCVEDERENRPDSARELVNQLEEIVDKREAEKQLALRQKAEEEQKRQSEIAKQKAEEERKRQAEIAKAEQEQKRQAEIAKQKAEQEQKKTEDENAWQKACQQNTKAAYKAYLDGNTLKKYADEAKQRLQAIIEQEELAKRRKAEEQQKKTEDENAWQKACQQNTKAAYQAYLDGNTLKKYADEAKQRLQAIIEKDEIAKKRQAEDENAWQTACKQNTKSAYQAYLNGNTLKKYADEAKQRLQAIIEKEEIAKRQAEDENAWQKARQQNTKAAYQAYLDGNTLKKYADEAKQWLQAIIEKEEIAKHQAEDENAWQKARQQNTKAAYQAYLDGNTLKKYADEAKQRLQAIIEQEELAKRRKEEQKHQSEIAKQKAEQEQKKRSYRYTDNGDGTATDNRTGLIWLKNANCFGKQNWKTAMQRVAKLADGQCGLSDGSKAGDWRLPTKEEWEAMVDKRYIMPALSNTYAFFGVQANNYWSSSTYARNMSIAWYVILNNGIVSGYYKNFTSYVWPVRGGH